MTAEVRANWAAQVAAMDAGDTVALRALFTADAVLVHMTGFVQPLQEWLDGMERGEFVYHRVAERGVDVAVLDESHARVVGHLTTGITDDGSGQAWPLRIEQDLVAVDGTWLCAASRVALDS